MTQLNYWNQWIQNTIINQKQKHHWNSHQKPLSHYSIALILYVYNNNIAIWDCEISTKGTKAASLFSCCVLSDFKWWISEYSIDV